MHRPIIIFDTSAINRLGDRPDFEAVRCGISSVYYVRSIETVIAELVANENKLRRMHLFKIERALRSRGDTTYPHHEILESLVRSFEANRSNFRWQDVLIKHRGIEDHLARNVLDDELAAAQKIQAAEGEKKWVETFRKLSVTYDEVLEEGQSPTSLVEMVELFERPGGALLQAWGKMLYKRDDGMDGDPQSIRQFYDECPPFRALVMAMLITQYDRCFRPIQKGGKSYRAGRTDTIMATYLPYCNTFVSEDPKQINLLKEVIIHARISDCSILSYEEFIDSLMLLSV
jgi:hypothetical protein